MAAIPGARLSTELLLVMLTQSITSLLLPGQYRDVDWIKATWVGNDGVTLVVAVPLLLAGIVLARRGSVRGLLLWLGTVGYAAYNYAFYLFGAALNAFFLLYVAAVVLAAILFIVTRRRGAVGECRSEETESRMNTSVPPHSSIGWIAAGVALGRARGQGDRAPVERA